MRSKLIILFIVILALAMPMMAQPPMPELDGEIVLDGLNGPQGVHVDADGNLWVIDSGLGGEEAIEFFNTQTYQPIDGAYGLTSQIIRLAPGGEPELIASLPSIATGEDFLGGARITVVDGTPYATVGGWHINLGEEVSLDNYDAVVTVTDGEVSEVADLWALELNENPDGTGNQESHPYGITAGEDGLLYVTDAAANDLVSVDPETGEVTLLAVFEGLPGVFPSPFRDGEMIADPVPTNVAFGADGGIYVSLLSGAPFIPGTAKVVQVAEDGTVSDFAPGLTMLTDLQAGPDGNLYAVSFGMFTEEGPVPNSGSIVRILPDGTSEVVIDGLPFATALGIDADGNGYVAVNGLPIPGAGLVVYYEGLTAMEGMAMESMGG